MHSRNIIPLYCGLGQLEFLDISNNSLVNIQWQALVHVPLLKGLILDSIQECCQVTYDDKVTKCFPGSKSSAVSFCGDLIEEIPLQVAIWFIIVVLLMSRFHGEQLHLRLNGIIRIIQFGMKSRLPIKIIK